WMNHMVVATGYHQPIVGSSGHRQWTFARVLIDHPQHGRANAYAEFHFFPSEIRLMRLSSELHLGYGQIRNSEHKVVDQLSRDRIGGTDQSCRHDGRKNSKATMAPPVQQKHTSEFVSHIHLSSRYARCQGGHSEIRKGIG
ncbi:MAG TPA: hypothetical protein DIT99_10595, partial [Candidatus Latescibacteria bacterium]|nr:hypothetical protein [Candidatus Latescibacterota bacterium]